jgi:hypothetical protein
MTVNPIVKKNGDALECTLCGAVFLAHKHVNMVVTNHVKTSHWDYVEKATEYIVSRLREIVLNSNKKQI